MRIPAFLNIVDGKMIDQGVDYRMEWYYIDLTYHENHSRYVLLIQREWDGCIAYWVNPSDETLKAVKANAFDMFSSGERLV